MYEPHYRPDHDVRKKDFVRLGRYSTEKAIYTVPDFDLWLKAIRRGLKFRNIQDPLIKYRQNPSGMTGENKKLMIEQHMVVWTRFMRTTRLRETAEKDKYAGKAESTVG